MLQSASQWLYCRVRLWMLILSALMFVFFMASVLPAEAARSREVIGSASSPDTSLVYTAGDLYRMAEQYGTAGRAYYVRARFAFDLLWPLVYGAFLTSALTAVYGRLKLPPILYMVNLLPLAAVDLDFLENLTAGLFMHRYPLASPFLAAVAPAATLSKWLFIGLSFGFLVAGLIMLASPPLRKSK